MIGLALSGGGSRAIGFHLGCLRALNDLGLLERIDVLSTISGGSVIGAYYAYTPKKSFDEFEHDVRRFLRAGFQTKVGAALINPINLLSGVAGFFLGGTQPGRFKSITDLFYQILDREVFDQSRMQSPLRQHIKNVVIGACDLRTGSAFRFGNDRSGSWRLGEMVDGNVHVALAVAASAAYPLLLPAINRALNLKRHGKEATHCVLLTDGGVYDNLGVQVLEPGRSAEFSLHTFACEYIIACNAGHGQASSEAFPVRFIPRVKAAFSITHRRVQDATMHRLHQLEQSQLLRGFALPYLGQQDHRLPYSPAGLISRAEVADYPTDFAAMSNEWIDKLSMRGEQLTNVLVRWYLPDLLQ
jgi:NTE family protein